LNAFQAIEPDTGFVTKKLTNLYHIQAGEDSLVCTLSARLKRQSDGDPVAIGDIVRWNEARQLIEVLPRRNQLARRAAKPMPDSYAREQVIAANLDQVIPVFAAANPKPAWNLLDRYLVSAESAEIAALIVLTKFDLVERKPEAAEILSVAAEYRAIGYQVIVTSAETGLGLEQLHAALFNRLSVFVGKSGVGKSSLLNALEPGLGLKVQQTSKLTGKGRHTTTHFEMFPLETGGAIIDTPGIREFGLWGVETDNLALFFPEMRPLVGACKFGVGCSHDQEPGCAIRRAVSAGQISPYRYQSYLKLRDEQL